MTDTISTRTTIDTSGRHYIIATDGSCNPNPGTGGWGVVIQLKQGDEVLKQRALAGQGEVMISTNNKMELTAPIKGLGRLRELTTPVLVLCDSNYVINGITSWLPNWKANNWKRKAGPVENQDLWQQLDQACEGKAIEWRKVKGHAGHKLNEMADILAGNATQGFYPLGEWSVMDRHNSWFF